MNCFLLGKHHASKNTWQAPVQKVMMHQLKKSSFTDLVSLAYIVTYWMMIHATKTKVLIIITLMTSMYYIRQSPAASYEWSITNKMSLLYSPTGTEKFIVIKIQIVIITYYHMSRNMGVYLFNADLWFNITSETASINARTVAAACSSVI